ncbi:MAG: hypothetical protein HYY13_01830 [Nitrospirae bacterium]|nr:hypothetical protein [Nitrospirota bacterium]
MSSPTVLVFAGSVRSGFPYSVGESWNLAVPWVRPGLRFLREGLRLPIHGVTDSAGLAGFLEGEGLEVFRVRNMREEIPAVASALHAPGSDGMTVLLNPFYVNVTHQDVLAAAALSGESGVTVASVSSPLQHPVLLAGRELVATPGRRRWSLHRWCKTNLWWRESFYLHTKKMGTRLLKQRHLLNGARPQSNGFRRILRRQEYPVVKELCNALFAVGSPRLPALRGDLVRGRFLALELEGAKALDSSRRGQWLRIRFLKSREDAAGRLTRPDQERPRPRAVEACRTFAAGRSERC